MICMDGWYCSRPYKSIYRGGLGNPDRPYKSICRGGYSTNRPYKSFFRKKNLNLQFKFDQNIYFSISIKDKQVN